MPELRPAVVRLDAVVALGRHLAHRVRELAPEEEQGGLPCLDPGGIRLHDHVAGGREPCRVTAGRC